MGFCKFRANILKIFLQTVLTIFFLLFGVELFLQTPFAKNQVKKLLIMAAKEKDIDLEIGAIEGHLPFEWKIKKVRCSLKDPITIDTIKARLSIWPLFKKQIEISYLQAYGGSFQNLPFEASMRGRFDLTQEKPIKIHQLLVEGEDLFFKMEGKLGYDLNIVEGDASFRLSNLFIVHPSISKGSLSATAHVTKETAHLESFAENISFGDQPIENTRFLLDARKIRTWWDGNAQVEGGLATLPMQGEMKFRFTPSCKLISIEDFNLKGPQTHCNGKIDLDPSFQCLEGTIFARCENLEIFQPFYPDSNVKGKMKGKIDFQSFSSFQDLKCQVDIKQFSAYDTTIETLSIESTLYDLFGDFRGDFAIVGKNLSLPEAEISELEINSTFEPNTSPFDFSIKGNWKDPIEITGDGQWQKRGQGIFLNMNHLVGTAFHKPFSLREAFSLEWNTDHFKMSNFSLDIARGHLFSRIDLTKSTSLIKIKAEEFPLEFIALPHKHFSLSGTSNIDIDLVSWEDNIQGNCNVALKKGIFRTESVLSSLTTKGSLQVHLNKGLAQVHGELKAKNGQFIQVQGTVPIKYQHFPFAVGIKSDDPLACEVMGEGKLEDLFDFINIGAHRIGGWLSTKLHISKTYNDPILRGSVEIQDGMYENYYTGTELKNIEAKATAKDQMILIDELKATDGDNGRVKATGEIALSPKENFPFSLNAKLHKCQAVAFDTITGKFSGNIVISGNRLGSEAKGSLKVAEAHFRIPDQLPSIIPELAMTFINPPENIREKKKTAPAVSPLRLDLDIDVPSKAFVEGKGINSELKGKLHITGTYTDIAADGKLELLKGEYIFFGKIFNLTQGELIFNDKPTPSAYISLEGNCDLPDVNVTVNLRGPLSAPKLSFQSSPNLPTSSLLSQILFNKDISEISAVQALQVAQTVISLSGSSGPDILEKIRKSLGIDRLTLITSESDPGKISLQIGKYLMRGVMLSLSRGVKNQNVAVEVELKKGIYFQAEVDETQEGKFSLKWHHHY